MNKIISLLLLYVVAYFCGCNPNNDKITLSDLYNTSRFEVTNFDTLIQNIQSVNDAVYIPSLNKYYLTGNNDNRNFFTCHVDAESNVSELRIHGGSREDFARKILITDDGNVYVVGGSNNNTIGQNDFMVVKTTILGEETSTNKYGTVNCDPLSSGILNSNNEIVLVGGTMKIGAPLCIIQDNYLIILNTDSEDTITTSRFNTEMITNRSQTIYAIAEIEEGNYMILHSASETNGIRDSLLLSTSSDLSTFSSTQELGISAFLNFNSTIVNSDNGFLIFTTVENSNRDNDISIIRTNSFGNILAEGSIESSCNESFKDHLILNDGSIIVAGNVVESQSNNDMLLCKLNADLAVEWCVQYGLESTSVATELLNFNQDVIKVIGYTNNRRGLNNNVVIFEVSAIDGSPVN